MCDALAAQLVAGTWSRPAANTSLKLPDGQTRKWEIIKADQGGGFSGRALAGGYVYVAVPSEREQVMILEATGHSSVFVNGEPHAGDPYGHGYLHLPVLLKRGTNDFLFHVGRGSLKAKLTPPKAEAYLDFSDTTLPDLIVGEVARTLAGTSSSTPARGPERSLHAGLSVSIARWQRPSSTDRPAQRTQGRRLPGNPNRR